MTEINVKIEAYGAVEKHLPHNLNLRCTENSSVAEALKQISDQYPTSAEILEKCACAIGEEIISRRDVLKNNCTLVLLSPVAGG